MELSFKDLDLKEVENVLKSIDFDTFLKGVFYIGNETEQIHKGLKDIRVCLEILNEILTERLSK